VGSWSPPALWAAAGVRARTTLVAIVVVGVVLALGFVLLTNRTRARLEDSITSAAETRALDVAALAEAGALPGTILSASAEQHVQVVIGDEVIAATFGLDLFPPLVADRPAPGASVKIALPEAVFQAIEDQSGLVEDESPYLLVARGYERAGEAGAVLVASSLDAAAAAVNALQPLLWIGWPITLVVVGATVWFLTGWALRPVEAMSEEADAISASALARRLPVPKANDEIRHLAATLNLMLSRLEGSAIRQRQFVSDASHELKTPLATMQTMLEVAAGDPEFADWHHLLAGLHRENDRMEGLVSDLLALARFDEGAPVAVREEVDLDQVLGRVAEQTGRQFPGIAFDTGGIRPVRVIGDGRALERLLSNVATNAARHAVKQVAFSCSADGDEACVLVVDDGPGIAAADRERVFERFVRLDEARGRPEGGTGLGLAVARAIARTHGGDVRVVESPTGAALQVRVPTRPGEPGSFSGRS